MDFDDFKSMIIDTFGEYLGTNDPEGFGCVCTPDYLCSTCKERLRQSKLRLLLGDFRAIN